jgi:hypothetical protein
MPIDGLEVLTLSNGEVDAPKNSREGGSATPPDNQADQSPYNWAA